MDKRLLMTLPIVLSLLFVPFVSAEENITVTDLDVNEVEEDSAIVLAYLNNHPEPEASSLNVTDYDGNVDPESVLGVYDYGGIYMDRPYWEHETEDWIIHISSEDELQWLITDDIDKHPHQSQFSKLAIDDPLSLWEEQRGDGTPKTELVEGEVVNGYFAYRAVGKIEWEYTDTQKLLADGVFMDELEDLESSTTYEYQAIAEYDGEVYISDIGTFETLAEEEEVVDVTPMFELDFEDMEIYERNKVDNHTLEEVRKFTIEEAGVKRTQTSSQFITCEYGVVEGDVEGVARCKRAPWVTHLIVIFIILMLAGFGYLMLR